MNDYELLCCIVNSGHGSKALKIAKNNGVKGGTICLGRGTVKNKLLEFLDLTDIRKEIVFLIAGSETVQKAAQALHNEMAFHKPNHGIAFRLSLTNFLVTEHDVFNKDDKVVNKTLYNAIFTVVDKGKAEDVIEAATKAGARGGTIINARGSGTHETRVLFAMPVEPEKEMVLILSKDDVTERIAESIRTELQIDKPGHGIIFIVGVNETYGLFDKDK